MWLRVRVLIVSKAAISVHTKSATLWVCGACVCRTRQHTACGVKLTILRTLVWCIMFVRVLLPINSTTRRVGLVAYSSQRDSGLDWVLPSQP